MKSPSLEVNSSLSLKQCGNSKNYFEKDVNTIAETFDNLNIEACQIKKCQRSERVTPVTNGSCKRYDSKKSSKEDTNCKATEENNLIGEKLNDTYTVESKLGQGTFGSVYKCFDDDTNDYVAVKAISNKESAWREIRIFLILSEKQIDSSSLIKCLESFEDNSFIYIVFPLYGPPLSNTIYDKKQPLTMEEIRTIARQLIETTKLLHDNYMLHSDIKPDNILLNRYYNDKRKPDFYKKPYITLCDLGSVYTEDEFVYGVITTLYYRAPDVVLGYEIGYHCDVWSIGCTIFELATSRCIFNVDSQEKLIVLIHNTLGPFTKTQIERIEHVHNEHRVNLEEEKNKFSDLSGKVANVNHVLEQLKQREKDLYDVIMKMLNIDPEERISLSDVLQLPFFTKE